MSNSYPSNGILLVSVKKIDIKSTKKWLVLWQECKLKL